MCTPPVCLVCQKPIESAVPNFPLGQFADDLSAFKSDEKIFMGPHPTDVLTDEHDASTAAKLEPLLESLEISSAALSKAASAVTAVEEELVVNHIKCA